MNSKEAVALGLGMMTHLPEYNQLIISNWIKNRIWHQEECNQSFIQSLFILRPAGDAQ